MLALARAQRTVICLESWHARVTAYLTTDGEQKGKRPCKAVPVFLTTSQVAAQLAAGHSARDTTTARSVKIGGTGSLNVLKVCELTYSYQTSPPRRSAATAPARRVRGVRVRSMQQDSSAVRRQVVALLPDAPLDERTVQVRSAEGVPKTVRISF